MIPITHQGYRLLHEGVIELSRIESNGIRIDVPLLQSTKERLQTSMRSIRKELENDKLWRIWHRRFGGKANLTSGDQLATILYQELGYEVTERTDTGQASTDEEALSKIDHPFVKQLVRFKKYDKALGTFLKGIEREVVNGRLHPVFNLHTARTYRSSSDSPNFQNFPVRDKEIAQIIRSLFIASPNHVLVENDFKGIEVSVSACYHHDANFISYITTPGKDMHRDMAAQIYMLDPKQVSKDARYGAKNKFVFPQFYGDFYVSCARALWEWIDKGKLKIEGTDISVADHLREKGIKELGACDPELEPKRGTFEKHVKDVEDDFWNNRFMDYGKWRKQWYRDYLDKGYFDLYTGFRIFGSYNRNSVTNYPIQGSAFHCLLWCLIQLSKALRKYKMESMLVGQIHDSMLGDVKESELKDYLELVESIVTVQLRKHYAEWMAVPLEIEYEISPRGQPWHAKREFKFKDGKFKHPTLDKWTNEPSKFLATLSTQ